MLVDMEPAEIAKLAHDAEAKLAQGLALTPQELLALLARWLTSQATRQERKYGRI
jgi:hypothetical protein